MKNAEVASLQIAANPDVRTEILDALNGLTLPLDPETSIRTFLSDDGNSTSIQAAALFVLWAKSDPAAALRFASDREEFRKMSCEDEALELIGESIPPDLTLSMAEDSNRDPLFAGLARQLIASKSDEGLLSLLERLESDVRGTVIFHLGQEWPAEGLNDYARLATAMDDPEMLERIVHDKLPREEMARWMMRYIDEHPDPEFAQKLRESTSYVWLLRVNPGISLDDRLNGLTSREIHSHKSAEKARADSMEFLAGNDVSGFFHNGSPDLLYAFHHGKIEAPEILAKLSARFPEYATAGLLPALLHQQLAPHDPDRAAILIAGLPEVERARVITESIWAISSLDSLARVLGNFPVSNNEEVLSYRRKSWRTFTDHGLDNYGEDYLRWIAKLPDSLDRKMALEAIADRIDGSMEFKANEIREIVGDIPLRDSP